MKKIDKSVRRIQWENFATNMYTQPFDNFRNIHLSFRTIFQLSPQHFFVTLRHDLLGHPRGQSVLYIVGESLLGWDTPGTWSHRIDEPRRGLFSCGFLLIVLPRIAMIDPFFNRNKSSEESVASFTTDPLSKRRDCIVASKEIVSYCGKGLDESGVVARVEGVSPLLGTLMGRLLKSLPGLGPPNLWWL
jgi:hypothetical protein